MEQSGWQDKKSKRIKCPECLNYMQVAVTMKGKAVGYCGHCHSKISIRQPSEKERLIRIVRQ